MHEEFTTNQELKDEEDEVVCEQVRIYVQASIVLTVEVSDKAKVEHLCAAVQMKEETMWKVSRISNFALLFFI